jgi:hypothetical protein
MGNGCKKPSGAVVAILVLAALLLVYPLSSGPAAWLASQTGFDTSAWETLYAPLLLAGEHSKFIWNKTHWYVGGWDSGIAMVLAINRLRTPNSTPRETRISGAFDDESRLS